MAATRKLQGEIDRCLKKVTEGVDTFEDIWQKVHNATNSNQKEKYEADLKKEIKKLQRLRDQIKSWIASGEIKDKSTLLDYRKLIETQMERFKVVERETKTKAYSKEGLGAAQKLDPAQKERDETAGWLATSIDALNLQLDQFECEIESLLAGKKKRLDKDKQDRVEDLKVKVEKHRYHIRKLETLLRMLDNMSVEVSQIRRIKDDIEYYIESSQEPDFEENEYIYDDIIGLDEVELSGVGLPSSATTDSNNSNDTGCTPTSTTSENSVGVSPTLRALHNHSSDSSNEEKRKNKDEPSNKPLKPTAVRPSNASSLISSSNCSQVPLKSVHNSSLSSKSASGSLSLTTPNNCSPSSGLSNHIGNFAAVAASSVQANSNSSSHIAENGRRSSSTPSGIGQIPSLLQIATSPPIPNLISHNHQQQNTHHHHHHAVHSGSANSQVSIGSQSTNSLHHQSGAQTVSTNPLTAAIQQHASKQRENLANSIDHHLQRNNSSSPLSSVSSAPSPVAAVSSPSPAQMQSASSHQLTHVPTLNGPIASKVPLPLSDSVEFFQRLSTETLFFIFYYMEGTKAQYLAAKALKKQSWRFHTKYMMWFQRHEEPKIINEEYEQGTYIYFDYEKWGQRKKEGFTFEYKYLEDRDLN
ncbi:CCR4-NOT transcription complex subunit 3 isoform X2 [Anabrus simplex]|uniref:CCR4-NOT transcription complex subunit 3 isoform X2 n=1 Tax=Anabrus simplex TaxID=316456 RepID=UPI0034DD444D